MFGRYLPPITQVLCSLMRTLATSGTIQVGRKVDENSPPGTRVGAPVEANDAPGDVLTYTLAVEGDNVNYSIHPATGQITVGARTALDREAIGGDFTHTVMVTATDPWGPSITPTGATTQEVTITINDVNEGPVISLGDTEASVVENTIITAGVGVTYMAYPEVITVPLRARASHVRLVAQGP